MITRHLFWSGGWDSTFRLLYVLFVRQEIVQPHYLIRLRRKSLHRELSAQATVRARLAAEFPDVARRLLPTKIMESSTIPVDAQVTQHFTGLVRARLLNAHQYKEMALYIAHLIAMGDIQATSHPPFEVGFINNGILHQRFCEDLEVAEFAGERQYTFRQQLSNPDLAFFRPFSFPVLFYTKPEMGKIARMYGFASLLYESWFCHRPFLGRIPCGTCAPCFDARHDGMGHRLHTISNVRYALRKYAYLPLRRLLHLPAA